MYRYLAWAVVIIGASGCNLSSLGDPVVVADVEDEFYLDIWEELTLEGRNLEFRFRTIANQPCENTTIDLDIQHINRSLSVSINEIVRPSDCGQGEAPARALASFKNLNDGFHPLSVDLRAKVESEGQLLKTSGAYEISLESGGGVVLLRERLNRIPDETIWGYLYYEKESLMPAAEDFLQRLGNMSKAHILREGYYGYFDIKDGKLRFNNEQAPNGATTFFYQYEGEREKLVELLGEYRTVIAPELQISLFNTQGEAL